MPGRLIQGNVSHWLGRGYTQHGRLIYFNQVDIVHKAIGKVKETKRNPLRLTSSSTASSTYKQGAHLRKGNCKYVNTAATILAVSKHLEQIR